MTDGELKIHSDTAWNIASQWSWTLASDTRTLAAQIDVALSEARATGRREGLSEAGKIAENIHAWKHCDGDFEANQVAAAIRAAMEKAE